MPQSSANPPPDLKRPIPAIPGNVQPGADSDSWLPWFIAICVVLAAGFELSARFGYFYLHLPYVVTTSFSMAGLFLLGGSAAITLKKVVNVPRVTLVAVWGAFFLVFSQIYSILGGLDSLERVPLLGDQSPWHIPIEEFSFVGGVCCIVTGFFLSILDAQRTRARLLREGDDLLREVAERSRAETALRESEEKYRNLVESFPHAVVIIQRDHIVFANPAAAAMLKLASAANLVGAHALEYIAEEERPRMEAYMRARFAGAPDAPQTYEARLRRADGDKFPALQYIRMITFGGQPAEQIVGVDVTERKKAEDALRQNEERFRQMAEGIREVFWISNVERTGVLYISPAFEEIWGITRERLYAEPRCWMDSIHPEDQERIARVIQDAPRGHPTDNQYRIVRPDGAVRWIRARAFPVRDDAGQVYRMAGIAEDFTERKHAEEALQLAYADIEMRVQERTARLVEANRKLQLEVEERERAERALHDSERRYRMLAEAAQDVIFVIGRDDTVEYVNSFAARQLGRPVDEIIGKPRASLFPPDVDGSQRQWLQAVFESGEQVQVENRAYFQDHEGWQDTRLVPLKDDHGAVIAVLGLAREITDRKQAEEALRQSEERYRGLIEHATDVVWRMDAAGRITYVSPVCERFSGYRQDEIVGRRFFDTVERATLPMAEESFARRIRNELGPSGLSLELLYRRKDGTTFWGETMTTPVFGPAGDLVEIQGITRDITERKQTQAALRYRLAMEETLAAISARFINIAPDQVRREIVHALEGMGRFVGADRVHVVLFSPDPTGLSTVYEWCADGIESWLHRFPELRLDAFQWSTGKLRRFEMVLARCLADVPPEGRAEKEIWESMGIRSVIGIPLVFGEQVGGFLGLNVERAERTWAEEDLRLVKIVAEIIANVLAWERAERALRESEERHRGLIEGLSEVVYRMSLPDGRYEYVGPAAQLVFGYTAEVIMQEPLMVARVTHPDSAAYFEQMWGDLLEGRMPPTYEYKIIDPEGNDRWILQSNTLVRDASGKAIAVEGICRNVTEEKRAQRIIEEHRVRLTESSKLSVLGEMAANIAHEINNPLAVISGSAEQLKSVLAGVYPTGDVVPKLTDTISRNAERIRRIISGLRTFTRSGVQDPFQEALLKTVIDDTLGLWHERFASQNVALTVNEVPADLTIECHPTQLMEVLVNLLSNALHAVEEAPERWVDVTVADLGEEVEVCVTDSGPGIPASIVKTLFDPFVTTKEPGRGTGLGLSISKRIVLSHNGVIRVDEGSPNTRFVIRLSKRQPVFAPHAPDA